jgi:hypothetical protein
MIKMRKHDIIWLVIMTIFWVSFLATFIIDYFGIIETKNLGYVETLWISWLMWTVGLGFILAALTRIIIKE